MSAYYNENDKFAAAWLRELIKAKLIADGEVDERSIKLVQPGDLQGFTQCHFFAGIGGWSYALHLAGWPDDREAWTGSCPCQPWSPAGGTAGFNDPRHLWPSWLQLIRERRPHTILGEQVAGTAGRAWLDVVCDDLEADDYSIGSVDLSARCVGAWHGRPRLWFVANTAGAGRGAGGSASTPRPTALLAHDAGWTAPATFMCPDGVSRPIEPGLEPLAHGLPARVGRLRGYGNAIVPQVAQVFIEAYMSIVEERRAAPGAGS